jgi:hypothetical protein
MANGMHSQETRRAGGSGLACTQWPCLDEGVSVSFIKLTPKLTLWIQTHVLVWF